MLRVGNLIPIAGTNQSRNAYVNPDFLVSWWQLFNSLVIYQQRNIPSTRWFKLNCHRRWRRAIRQISRPNNIKWLLTLSKPQFAILPFKCRLGKLSRATVTLFLKPRIFSSFSPEVSKSFLKMSQTLLQRYTANLIKKVKLRCLFPSSQKTRSLFVTNSLFFGVPGFGSSCQSFVVNQTNARLGNLLFLIRKSFTITYLRKYLTQLLYEDFLIKNKKIYPYCPSQEIFLLWSWVKTIFIGAFSHLQQLIYCFSHFTTFFCKNTIGGAHSSPANPSGLVGGLPREIR